MRIEQEQKGLMLMDTGTPMFSSLDEDLVEDSISPDDVNEVLKQLEAPMVGSEDLLDEDGSSFAGHDEDLIEDSQLDLSAGVSDKAADPVRLYMREMGTVPLLNREQEVSIAKRIESGICHVNGPTLHDEAQMPFGGTKASGYGRFGGKAGIAEFTELRWITIETGPQHYPI